MADVNTDVPFSCFTKQIECIFADNSAKENASLRTNTTFVIATIPSVNNFSMSVADFISYHRIDILPATEIWRGS